MWLSVPVTAVSMTPGTSGMLWSRVCETLVLPTPLRCRVVCPALGPNQGHKAHLAPFLLLGLGSADARQAYEHLMRGLGAHRNHETPTERQLLLQRRGDRWSASRDYNAVIWRVFRPTQRAVTEVHDHIVVPELA